MQYNNNIMLLHLLRSHTLWCHTLRFIGRIVIRVCYYYYNIYYAGFYYDNQTIHDFKVQCPNDTYLHLYVQESSLPITAGICFG